MITDKRRDQLWYLWNSEIRFGDEWRAELTEEEQYMVEVWDWTRRTEEDRVTRAYWDERRREA